MATDDYKPADANKDGEVTKKEREKYRKTKAETAAAAGKKPTSPEPPKDLVDKAELEKRFGFAKDVIWQNKELRGLYQRAIKGQWTDAMFQSQLRGSKWYENNAEYARKAWVAERTGGADWEAQVSEAESRVQQQATAMGARLSPEQVKALGKRYITEGWGEASRQQFMSQALSESLSVGEGGFMAGAAGDFQQSLMETARRNGLKYSSGFYESAAKSVAQGLTSQEDWARDMRTQAAAMWTPWSDKIMAGVDAEDLMSGYKSMMAQTMEIDPDSIGLDDPRLMKAVMTQDGKPMGLYDFQLMLREDPAWMQTKQATDSVSSIGMDILRRFGFQS